MGNVILGAGIAGLACAHELKKQGRMATIYEAQPWYGGLCHSFKVDDFVFDSAVHLSFTTNEDVRNFFDQARCYVHKPLAYNYYQGYWLKHPVLNNMYELPIEDKVKYLESFLERPSYGNINNYGEWLRASYGNAIAEDFYYQYTRKYWTVEPEELSTTWVGNRLNIPDLKKMLAGCISNQTGNDYYAKEMRYPKQGGFQEFINPLAKEADIRLNKKVVRINADNHEIEFEDGECVEYDCLYSSIPLPEMVRIVNGVPSTIRELGEGLKASKISLVSVGLARKELAKYLWFYIYDKEIKAARAYSPSLKSPNNVPTGCSSMQFEVYHNPNECIDAQQIVKNVRKSLVQMGICEEEDILFLDYRLLEYGNVIFYQGMEQKRDIVKNYMEKQGINLIGRFGEWEYYWSDQSYLSGIQKAKMGEKKC